MLTNKGFKGLLRSTIDDGLKTLRMIQDQIEQNKKIASDADYYGAKKREEASQLVNQLKAQHSETIRTVNEEVKQLCDKFSEQHEGNHGVKGEELNADAQLLSYDLTAADLRKILKRNPDNNTIKHLVSNYALQRNIINNEKHENTDLLFIDTELGKTKEFIDRISHNVDKYLWRSVDEIGTEGSHFYMMYDTIMNEVNEAFPDEKTDE